MTRHDRWSGDDILATPDTQNCPIIEVGERTRLTDPKSRFAGTVVEFVPGESVVLIASSGQQRSRNVKTGLEQISVKLEEVRKQQETN